MVASPVNRSTFDSVMVPNYAPLSVVPVRGEGCWLWDQGGRDYLDLAGGIAVNAFGHCHPELVSALNEQAHRLWHVSNIYTNEPALNLASELCAATFADRAFFANSGAEANEAAMKLARRRGWSIAGAGKHRIIAARGAFHGRTLFTVTAGGQAKYTEGFEPVPAGFEHVAFNDTAALEAAMDDSVCAILVEPVQGEGGVYPADPGFLEEARDLCNQHDAVLIFDEVQSGMGRTGDLFAYMGYGVVPDILTSAKALGGGFPISAMLTTESVASYLPAGSHGSTYGGNPLGCAVARRALAIVQRPEVANNVRARHDQFREGLSAINDRYDLFSEIRGKGLLIGAELNGDWAARIKDVLQCGLEAGVMMLSAGSATLRLAPSLLISEQETAQALERIERAVALASERTD